MDADMVRERQEQTRQEWLRALREVAGTPEGQLLFGRMLFEDGKPCSDNNALIQSYKCGRREAFREIIQDLRATSFALYEGVVRSQEERNHA